MAENIQQFLDKEKTFMESEAINKIILQPKAEFKECTVHVHEHPRK